jgi:hypothetical protein
MKAQNIPQTSLIAIGENQNMKMFLLIIAFLIVMPAITNAGVYGGSNLGFQGYPSHQCRTPYKPNKPYSFDNQWEVDLYNSKVNSYNLELESYIRCIEEYIDNANNDIKRIQERVQEAVD